MQLTCAGFSYSSHSNRYPLFIRFSYHVLIGFSALWTHLNATQLRHCLFNGLIYMGIWSEQQSLNPRLFNCSCFSFHCSYWIILSLPGGLWPLTSTLLSSNRCCPHLLFHWKSIIIRECSWKMDPWARPPYSLCTQSSSRMQSRYGKSYPPYNRI